jgi:hypothetical protein
MAWRTKATLACGMGLLWLAACEKTPPHSETDSRSLRAPVDSFATVADSAWVDVKVPSIIGFFPIVTKEQLRTDADLAELLDHFTFNLGIATDSLTARGFHVDMRGGDTLWLRTTAARWRFARDTDSSRVGFYFVMPDGRRMVHYGSGVDINLVAAAETFARPGGRR